MNAYVLTGHGGPDKLVWHEDWPRPEPRPGEALLRVLACGLNNTDINTRTGWYAKSVREGTVDRQFDHLTEGQGSWGDSTIKFPRIQGADVCARVEAIGEGVDSDLIGRRVMVETWLRDWDNPDNLEAAGYFGSEVNGGYAEYCAVDARYLHVIDCSLSDAEIATFATSYITAENMLARAGVKASDTVLIPGASGGVGSALIQLAHRRGARTVAMCGASKAEAVAALGPAAVLEREPADIASALRHAIGTDKVSVVADVVGGPIFSQLLEVLERGGRYTCAGAIAGPIVEFDLRTFYLNNLTFVGATVVPPGMFADLVGYIERGEIKPLLAATYPLKELPEAQAAFTAKKHVGNIVVTP